MAASCPAGSAWAWATRLCQLCQLLGNEVMGHVAAEAYGVAPYTQDMTVQPLMMPTQESTKLLSARLPAPPASLPGSRVTSLPQRTESDLQTVEPPYYTDLSMTQKVPGTGVGSDGVVLDGLPSPWRRNPVSPSTMYTEDETTMEDSEDEEWVELSREEFELGWFFLRAAARSFAHRRRAPRSLRAAPTRAAKLARSTATIAHTTTRPPTTPPFFLETMDAALNPPLPPC